MILNIFVRYKHELLLRNDAKPNQEHDFVRYNREFVVTVIVITAFDCSPKPKTKLQCQLKLVQIGIIERNRDQLRLDQNIHPSSFMMYLA